MRRWLSASRLKVLALLLLVIAPVIHCLAQGSFALRTPDQRAYILFEGGDYGAAAEAFADPMWQGVALFRAGEFKQAAGVFAGYDTAEAAFNHGNALVMLGKYEDAARRYARALELRPTWEDATINLQIALARAELLKQEGGEGTGGKLGADEIVFSKGKSSPDAGEEQIEGGQEMNDADLRAVWLRQVQTKPADFLRAKFAYQQAMGEAQGD